MFDQAIHHFAQRTAAITLLLILNLRHELTTARFANQSDNVNLMASLPSQYDAQW